MTTQIMTLMTAPRAITDISAKTKAHAAARQAYAKYSTMAWEEQACAQAQPLAEALLRE